MCNNAGVVTLAPIWEQTLDDWRWVLGVDLWGVIHGVRSFLPLLLDQGEPGHIVNTASIAGLVPSPGIAPYNVSKAGVVALSETLDMELRDAGAPIGVSVLCPGVVPTRIAASGRNRPGGATGAARHPHPGRPPPDGAHGRADRRRRRRRHPRRPLLDHHPRRLGRRHHPTQPPASPTAGAPSRPPTF